MTVRPAKPEDCHTISRLMGLLIDEIYAKESDRVRKALRANFTEDGLKELCGDEHAVLLVAEVEGQVVAFLFGWLFHFIFTMYWIYSLKEFRGHGAVRMLLAELEKVLSEKGAYKIEMYAYAEHNRFLGFCTNLGFEKGVLIEKSLFGFKIQKIFKYIGPLDPSKLEKRIKIIGEAGQGVKLLSNTLAQILAQLGNEVSLSLNYDASVRGGNISADLIYSDFPIENPLIDEADVLIKFTRTRDFFPAKSLVIDESFCEEGAVSCSIKSSLGTYYGFEDVALSVFGSKVFINMIALGRILRYIGINILLLNIKDILPKRSQEKNFEAVKYGFNFRDDI
jgi:Pyruvate/2-oxoacid:ferredoxin oxidoreductase gamma subunit/ribosomal protein S18 acetylase RimI-like enzyme